MAPHPAPRRQDVALSDPASGGDHLTLVSDAPVVYLSFADRVELRRTGPVWRRRLRRFPGGRIHAAEVRGEATLCGTPVHRLEDFGRSRHPFEHVAETDRCPDCHVGAGRPIG